MPYAVTILEDSINPIGKRLTTFELSYPRFIHSELLTHRIFSRNSSSSRAIPIDKMIKNVETDLLYPKWWGENQSGMQAKKELTGKNLEKAKLDWDACRDRAVFSAKQLHACGLHKQIVNRILEPFMFITTLVTATEWENWFNLRAHADAQPEIGWVATEMKKQYNQAYPKKLKDRDWHRPLLPDIDILNVEGWLGNELNLISVGRCARVSYLTHTGVRDPEKDIKLASTLLKDGHMSPFEHVAECTASDAVFANFTGWRQHRYLIPGEAVFKEGR